MRLYISLHTVIRINERCMHPLSYCKTSIMCLQWIYHCNFFQQPVFADIDEMTEQFDSVVDLLLNFILINYWIILWYPKVYCACWVWVWIDSQTVRTSAPMTINWEYSYVKILSWCNVWSSFNNEQNLNVVFKCTCCLYLQIIKILCPVKFEISHFNLIFDLSIFSVYGHGVWFWLMVLFLLSGWSAWLWLTTPRSREDHITPSPSKNIWGPRR